MPRPPRLPRRSLPALAAGALASLGLGLVLVTANQGPAAALGLPLPTPTPTATATPPPPPGFVRPPIATPLRVVGNQVVDANGTRIILGGVHRANYQQFSGSEITAAEADNVAKFASIVRLQVSGQMVTTDECGSHAQYLARLDRAIAKLIARNVVTLLDLHYMSVPVDDSGVQHACKNRVLTLPVRAQATTVWQLLGARYASNPLVAFELFNEPHPMNANHENDWNAWLNGDTESYGALPTATYPAAGMKELFATVASVSSQNLVFIDANGYGGDPRLLSTADLGADPARTVWAMHSYTCPHVMSASDSIATDCKANYATKRQFPVATEDAKGWGDHGQPVVITETGFPDSGPPNNNGVGYDPAGDWLRTTSCWAGDQTKHGGSVIGVIAFADADFNDPDWSILDATHSWQAFDWGKPLVNFLQGVQPPGGGIVPAANTCP